jgi:hypothetical protein
MVKKHDIPVTESSGNVFADLGFDAPDEELTKAQLTTRLRQVAKDPRQRNRPSKKNQEAE